MTRVEVTTNRFEELSTENLFGPPMIPLVAARQCLSPIHKPKSRHITFRLSLENETILRFALDDFVSSGHSMGISVEVPQKVVDELGGVVDRMMYHAPDEGRHTAISASPSPS